MKNFIFILFFLALVVGGCGNPRIDFDPVTPTPGTLDVDHYVEHDPLPVLSDVTPGQEPFEPDVNPDETDNEDFGIGDTFDSDSDIPPPVIPS